MIRVTRRLRAGTRRWLEPRPANALPVNSGICPSRIDPAKQSACLGLDGTRKTKELDNFQRDWPNIIIADDATIRAVDEKWAQLGIGDIQKQRGKLDMAFATYQGAQALAEHSAKSDPGDAEWQRVLSVSYEKVGDMRVAQGNLPAS